jgi:hypothetical protein
MKEHAEKRQLQEKERQAEEKKSIYCYLYFQMVLC